MGKVTKRKGLTPKQRILVECLAFNPSMQYKELEKKLHITRMTIHTWLADPKVSEAIYNRYMDVAGSQLPKVLQAQFEEAFRGSTKAAELVLKHFGKLKDVVEHRIISPFDQHLKLKQGMVDVQEGEILDAEEVKEMEELMPFELPSRDESNDNPNIKTHRENKRLEKRYTQIRNDSKARERRAWRERAKKIGVPLLPQGKQKKEVYEEWQNSVVEAEEKFMEDNKYGNKKTP